MYPQAADTATCAGKTPSSFPVPRSSKGTSSLSYPNPNFLRIRVRTPEVCPLPNPPLPLRRTPPPNRLSLAPADSPSLARTDSPLRELSSESLVAGSRGACRPLGYFTNRSSKCWFEDRKKIARWRDTLLCLKPAAASTWGRLGS